MWSGRYLNCEVSEMLWGEKMIPNSNPGIDRRRLTENLNAAVLPKQATLRRRECQRELLPGLRQLIPFLEAASFSEHSFSLFNMLYIINFFGPN